MVQPSRKTLGDVLWLQYFNRYLYQNGVIDRAAYEKMCFMIRRKEHDL